MLLVTTVENLEPGQSIETTFFVDPSREIFKGHFPGNPVLPGVYSIECIAQAVDILLMSGGEMQGKTPLFLGCDNVRFKKMIRPSDTVRVEAKLASSRPEKAIYTCHGEMFNQGVLAVVADITIAMR